MSSAATKDIRTEEFRAHLDKFKAFRVEEGSHWRGPIDSSYVLNTAAWEPLQYVKKREDYKVDTPYLLEKNLAGLFPEWYFHLIRNFARRSAFHSFYCTKTRTEFHDFLAGPDLEKDLVTSAMDYEFLCAFKAGLGEALNELFEHQILSRSNVESSVVQELASISSWTTTLARMNLLIVRAIRGDLMPYAFFLMAYDCSENYIWMKIAALLLKHCRTEEKVEFLQLNINTLRGLQSPIISRLRELVARLDDFGILSKGTESKLKPQNPAQLSVVSSAAVSPNFRNPEHNGTNPPGAILKLNGIKTENEYPNENFNPTPNSNAAPLSKRAMKRMKKLKEDRNHFSMMNNPNSPLYKGKRKLPIAPRVRGKKKKAAGIKKDKSPAVVRRTIGREREGPTK